MDPRVHLMEEVMCRMLRTDRLCGELREHRRYPRGGRIRPHNGHDCPEGRAGLREHTLKKLLIGLISLAQQRHEEIFLAPEMVEKPLSGDPASLGYLLHRDAIEACATEGAGRFDQDLLLPSASRRVPASR
jgi:hypothetical protein